MLADDDWVPLAEVLRPHGVRGELRLRLYNRDSDLLLDQDEVASSFADGEEQGVSVDGARRADMAILLKLHSVDTRDRADELRAAVICIRRGSFPQPAPGEFYACDVEGARVVIDEGGGVERYGPASSPFGAVRIRRRTSLEVGAADQGRPGRSLWWTPSSGASMSPPILVTLSSTRGCGERG